MTGPLAALGREMLLGPLFARLRDDFGGFELLHHYQQGEFHHDLIVRVVEPGGLPGSILVATNCNGGVKEVLAFAEVPERWALWAWRCPDNDEFAGELPPLLDLVRTAHWFDPCELLGPDARSELRPECRRRQRGGGWQMC